MGLFRTKKKIPVDPDTDPYAKLKAKLPKHLQVSIEPALDYRERPEYRWEVRKNNGVYLMAGRASDQQCAIEAAVDWAQRHEEKEAVAAEHLAKDTLEF